MWMYFYVATHYFSERSLNKSLKKRVANYDKWVTPLPKHTKRWGIKTTISYHVYIIFHGFSMDFPWVFHGFPRSFRTFPPPSAAPRLRRAPRPGCAGPSACELRGSSPCTGVWEDQDWPGKAIKKRNRQTWYHMIYNIIYNHIISYNI